jgi:hypothetical protein
MGSAFLAAVVSLTGGRDGQHSLRITHPTASTHPPSFCETHHADEWVSGARQFAVEPTR